MLAVGGYGRAEMAPFSDVDLLFVTPYKQTPWGESLIESVLYCLWDLRLKVGQSVRTIDDCLRLARSDVTIRTSLLEHRQLWGDERLAERLRARLWSELFEQTGPEFVALKLAERAERHARQGSSRYLLEPNVKEGKGGLRDLQTLFWIGKYLNRAETSEDLVRADVFTPEEYRVFAEAEAFLWTTRVHLHLLNGRAGEQLTFDTQVEIAALLGYRPTEGQRSVERFMQDYFTHAKHVGDLTRIFLAALEARHVKPRPSLGEKLRTVFAFGKDPTRPGYRLKNGRLDFVDETAFAKDPINILRLFEEALETDIPIHPDALRRVAANLHLIDDAFRASPEANRIFLDLLLSHNNPEGALRLMNEVGVLGAFIPEFGRIVAMMQFNMYHYYTVDEHIDPHHLDPQPDRAARAGGRAARSAPTSWPRASTGASSTWRSCCTTSARARGATIRSTAPRSRSGSARASASTPRRPSSSPGWCSNHLLMSDTAQKRDLAEPRTVRDFAQAVKSPTRLKLLTVLTACDIRGVGPGVWNNWKAMLLRGLYGETLEHLTGGSQASSRPEREAAAKAALAAALAGWSEAEIEAECARHYAPYWLGFDTRTHAIFAELVRQVSETEPAMQIELDLARDATQACFAMPDHPGIFARLAGALALAGANVVDARTYTTTDGIATAAFWIQDQGGKPYESARLTRLRNAVNRTLRGEIFAREALKDKDRIKKRERDFTVPTRLDLRQRRLGHLHHHRGRDPRPAGPALRPRAHADRQQHLDLLGDHRHLRRAGGGRLLRQGPVRAEAARREQAAHARVAAARGDRRRPTGSPVSRTARGAAAQGHYGGLLSPESGWKVAGKWLATF